MMQFLHLMKIMLLKLVILQPKNSKIPHEAAILEQEASILFSGPNDWLFKKLETVVDTEEFLDAEIKLKEKLCRLI